MSANDNALVINNLIAQTSVPALLSEEPGVATWDKSVTSDYKKQATYTTGQTINIRIEDQPSMPVKSNVFSNDPIVQTEIPITVYQWNKGFILSEIQQMLESGGEERVKKMIILPRVKTLGIQANIEGYNTLCGCPLFFGTPGQELTNFLAWANGSALLDNMLCPTRNRYGAMSPTTMVKLSDNVKNWQDSKESRVAFLDGEVKEAAGINFFRTTNLPNHTNGTLANANGTTNFKVATNVTSGATSVAVSGGTSAGTLTVGSVIRFTGIKMIQPQSKKVLDDDMTFTVTELLTLSGGAGTMKVYPAIVGPENPKLQTVSALPTTANYIEMIGVASGIYAQSALYHGDAVKFVSLKLEELIMNQNAFMDAEGISVRVASIGDNTNSQNNTRLDILFGTALSQWHHACRSFTKLIGLAA